MDGILFDILNYIMHNNAVGETQQHYFLQRILWKDSDVCLQNLIKQRSDILNNMILQLDRDTADLAVKAENMAECATNIKGQGYCSFITAREEFLNALTQFKRDYTSLVKPNS